MTDDLKSLPEEERVAQMLSGYWWGIPTFFARPHDRNPANSDIALIGVPHSSGNGSTERDQHLGPRALRDVSGAYLRPHKYFGIVPWEVCRIHDLGDVPLPRAMVNDITIKDIGAYYEQVVAAGAHPVSIGGDHSVTLPILRAIAGKNSPLTDQPIALVHFDAHSDAFESGEGGHFLGNQEWAGNWGVTMNKEGLVNPKHVVTIGIRGHGSSAEYHEKVGYQVIDMDEFEEIGVKKVIEKVRATVGDIPVYITFDLDSLDPAHAPGVSNIEPGFDGITIGQATRILRSLRGLKVIGGDVVCPMPIKDNPNRVTSMNAAVIMFEMMSLIADRLNESTS